MFRDRQDAAARLAKALLDRSLRDPVVLAIPRGGIAIGAGLAERIGAELDVTLSRKLRAPAQPELAIGAVSETGQVFLNEAVVRATGASPTYVEHEKQFQLQELARRQKLFREIRPPAVLKGRSVIVTDDGIATGSTMLAALQAIQAQQPHEVIVAIPVAPPDRLIPLKPWCQEIVCLMTPSNFRSVGQHYLDFGQLDDGIVSELLQQGGLSRRRITDSAHPLEPDDNRSA